MKCFILDPEDFVWFARPSSVLHEKRGRGRGWARGKARHSLVRFPVKVLWIDSNSVMFSKARQVTYGWFDDGRVEQMCSTQNRYNSRKILHLHIYYTVDWHHHTQSLSHKYRCIVLVTARSFMNSGFCWQANSLERHYFVLTLCLSITKETHC